MKACYVIQICDHNQSMSAVTTVVHSITERNRLIFFLCKMSSGSSWV